MFFNEIDQGGVLIRTKGIRFVCKLFELDGNLYAKKGSGFIKLYKNQRTSVPNIHWTKVFPGETGSIDETVKGTEFLHWIPSPALKTAAE